MGCEDGQKCPICTDLYLDENGCCPNPAHPRPLRDAEDDEDETTRPSVPEAMKRSQQAQDESNKESGRVRISSGTFLCREVPEPHRPFSLKKIC